MLTNIYKNLVGFIIHKFVRNFTQICKIGKIVVRRLGSRCLIFCKFVRKFTHICKKILQLGVKLGKWCLVGLGPGAIRT
jgi:hypothetical protein